ncbi:hypothetical protein LCGC14_2240110, partial [marine sediment metagenome]
MSEVAPTIGIEYNGVRKDFVVAPDEDGGFQWFEGLVEPIVAQQSGGGFGYHSQPFKVNTPITFEEWSGGCGVEYERPGTFTTTKYSHTFNVDLSWGRRGYLSPERQASTDLTADWVRIAFTSKGVFVLVADEVWEWDSGGPGFVSRISGAGTTPTDIVEYGDSIYVAMGDGNDYQYSSDGTSWTASTLTVKRFDQFAVRSGQDGTARLWGVLSTGELRQNDNATNGGTEWSASTQIGDTWETLHRMVAGAEAAGDDEELARQVGRLRAGAERALRAARGGDGQLEARIEAYELAFRMQAAAPIVVDFADETAETLEMYGIGQ